MTRLLLIFLLILATARFFWRLVDAVMRAASAGPSDAAQGRSPGGRRGPASPAHVKMQPCPVCGTYVVPGKAISIVSGGNVVYFCSDNHRAEYQSR